MSNCILIQQTNLIYFSPARQFIFDKKERGAMGMRLIQEKMDNERVTEKGT